VLLFFYATAQKVNLKRKNERSTKIIKYGWVKGKNVPFNDRLIQVESLGYGGLS
jgi:hypothetical protein